MNHRLLFAMVHDGTDVSGRFLFPLTILLTLVGTSSPIPTYGRSWYGTTIPYHTTTYHSKRVSLLYFVTNSYYNPPQTQVIKRFY